MAAPDRDTLLIPYGRAHCAPGETGEPAIVVRGGVALRLADGPYPFPEPPDLIRIATVAERLDLLREHLQSLCGLWDRPSRQFLDAYFAHIAAAIAASEPALAALAAGTGGLFAPPDWSFAALRPLPQAHLDGADDTPPVRVDFAFWTGDALVAIELRGSASPRRQRQAELQRLAASGVRLVEVPAQALRQEGAALLARLLPAPFQRFWEGVRLPKSPFAPQTLDTIVAAGDQSVISMT
ncbi:MAG TPA: hypothetical protein VMU87_21240 [Stellaceae bacterium]|nr:hypothetical protein [Stellaceae bacterium]